MDYFALNRRLFCNNYEIKMRKKARFHFSETFSDETFNPVPLDCPRIDSGADYDSKSAWRRFSRANNKNKVPGVNLLTRGLQSNKVRPLENALVPGEALPRLCHATYCFDWPFFGAVTETR